MLDPRLHTFLLLVQCKSTTRCAALLHVTQPAVTQHIRGLEKAYGVKLFVKEGRQLALTEDGSRLARLCKRLCTMDEQIMREMHQSAARPVLRFGATLSIADGLMPQLLPLLMDRFPQVQFHMVQQNTHALLEQLEEGELDFALIEGNFDRRRYAHAPFFTSRFLGLCRPGSDFCRLRRLEQAVTAPLILRESGSGTRDIFENECRLHNLRPEDFADLCEVEHIPTLLHLVAMGKGITFAYEAAAAPLLQNGQLAVIPLEDFRLQRAFEFVYLPGHPRQEQLEEMTAAIRADAQRLFAQR